MRAGLAACGSYRFVAWLSDNSLLEALGTRALFLASDGGADFGECWQAVQRVGDGGADEWYREWTAVADWLVELGDASAERGHPVSARAAYVRATNYYRTSYGPLFGEPPIVGARQGDPV